MIVYQKRIYRVDLHANPDVLYVFGDNDRRRGMGGQAGEMRGEPNAVGVRTKWSPGNHPNDYFSDSQIFVCKSMIDHDLNTVRDHLAKGGTVVVPMDGVGTGLSELHVRAPAIYSYLITLGLGAKVPTVTVDT